MLYKEIIAGYFVNGNERKIKRLNLQAEEKNVPAAV
jgi:hypothetical protein